MERCKALFRVPAAFSNSSGQGICDLHINHTSGLHYDDTLQLWWLPALLAPGDRPAVVGLGDLEAALWRLLARRRVIVPDAEPFVDELLAMFTAYAAGNGPDLTRERVQVLKNALGGNHDH